MITLQKTRHRTREFRGPEPGSVAILARPSGKRQSDKIIQDLKREAEYRANCEDEAREILKTSIRTQWEKSSSDKMMNAALFRKFNSARHELVENIEVKRDRLRQLIAEEHEQFTKEMEASYETVIERQAKLREKARKLKEEKVLDNQMIAQMKYEQLWRDQCEALRTVISKKTAQEIALDNLEILRQKEFINVEKEREKEYFDALWQNEIKKKEEREQIDLDKAHERNQDMMRILNEQKAVVAERKRREKELKEEEKRLRLEMLELRKLERDNSYEEKLKKQQKTREIFDENLRLKMKRLNKEKQEEIALDSQLIERLLAETEAEAGLQYEKKRQLMEDSKRYREYLRQLKEQEEAREKELDEMMNEEIRKQWQKRLDQWDRESEARKKLLHEVLRVRQAQVEDRIRKNLENQQLAKLEREQFAKDIEKNKIEDIQKKREMTEKDRSYRNDLLQQIQFNSMNNRQKEIELEMERQSMKEEEDKFNDRIVATLNKEWIDPRMHPWRRYEMQKQTLNN